jgi:hypothetical protein
MLAVRDTVVQVVFVDCDVVALLALAPSVVVLRVYRELLYLLCWRQVCERAWRSTSGFRGA